MHVPSGKISVAALLVTTANAPYDVDAGDALDHFWTRFVLAIAGTAVTISVLLLFFHVFRIRDITARALVLAYAGHGAALAGWLPGQGA